MTSYHLRRKIFTFLFPRLARNKRESSELPAASLRRRWHFRSSEKKCPVYPDETQRQFRRSSTVQDEIMRMHRQQKENTKANYPFMVKSFGKKEQEEVDLPSVHKATGPNREEREFNQKMNVLLQLLGKKLRAKYAAPPSTGILFLPLLYQKAKGPFDSSMAIYAYVDCEFNKLAFHRLRFPKVFPLYRYHLSDPKIEMLPDHAMEASQAVASSLAVVGCQSLKMDKMSQASSLHFVDAKSAPDFEFNFGIDCFFPFRKRCHFVVGALFPFGKTFSPKPKSANVQAFLYYLVYSQLFIIVAPFWAPVIIAFPISSLRWRDCELENGAIPKKRLLKISPMYSVETLGDSSDESFSPLELCRLSESPASSCSEKETEHTGTSESKSETEEEHRELLDAKHFSIKSFEAGLAENQCTYFGQPSQKGSFDVSSTILGSTVWHENSVKATESSKERAQFKSSQALEVTLASEISETETERVVPAVEGQNASENPDMPSYQESIGLDISDCEKNVQEIHEEVQLERQDLQNSDSLQLSKHLEEPLDSLESLEIEATDLVEWANENYPQIPDLVHVLPQPSSKRKIAYDCEEDFIPKYSEVESDISDLPHLDEQFCHVLDFDKDEPPAKLSPHSYDKNKRPAKGILINRDIVTNSQETWVKQKAPEISVHLAGIEMMMVWETGKEKVWSSVYFWNAFANLVEVSEHCRNSSFRQAREIQTDLSQSYHTALGLVNELEVLQETEALDEISARTRIAQACDVLKVCKKKLLATKTKIDDFRERMPSSILALVQLKDNVLSYRKPLLALYDVYLKRGIREERLTVKTAEENTGKPSFVQECSMLEQTSIPDLEDTLLGYLAQLESAQVLLNYMDDILLRSFCSLERGLCSLDAQDN
ncbi:hypothetical protein FOB63_002963 [Clavispora lusitaniae]|uniref:uncharacterized protein n=1 Tax=Clavispora lusitaniae TaxID=36911 RepID=UPI00202C8298|nr:hypothetical protein FOB63_002963 [Clavispora lusitaniae]